MQQAHNWANNYRFRAAHIHRPRSVDELRRLVAKSAKIRAIGTRHSFNGIADSPGDLVDLSALDPHFVIDEENETATVGAATTYGALARYLHSKGWALHNLASLPHISIAGAIATATHGSGDRCGNLATAVAGIELVTASGDLVQVHRGDAGFDGIVVGLGAFGIVTRVTLELQPNFDIRQDAFVALPWAALLSDFDDIMSAAYSVSVLTRWSDESVDRLWLKSRLPDNDSARLAAARLGARPDPCPNIREVDDGGARMTAFGAPGPWCERLAHFLIEGEPGISDQIQSEYMLPRSVATTALARLRTIGREIDQTLRASEIRTVMGDRLWLSPSYKTDSVAIHFTWKGESEPVDAITRQIEHMLIPLGARPHWGKLMHARADQIARLYPRLSDFKMLARTYDPTGKFRNDFLDAHVFG